MASVSGPQTAVSELVQAERTVCVLWWGGMARRSGGWGAGTPEMAGAPWVNVRAAGHEGNKPQSCRR